MLVKHFFECSVIINPSIEKSESRMTIMYFYQRLKDMREDLDKKQEDIALVLNITRQQYQLYESGKREMPMHHFVILAKYYNVSLDYLSGLIDTPKKLK
jgi:transcriptional regulator with XRE-family HTH domain